MSVLTMSSGLLLIFHVHIRCLADCLAESNLRSLEHNLHFISGSKLACRDLQMLVAHSV